MLSRLRPALLFGLLLLVAGLLLVRFSLSPRSLAPQQLDESAQAVAGEVERRPNETGWLQRTYPHYQADPAAYRDAQAQAQRLRRSAKRTALDPWQFAGPTNIGGRVVDVAIDPRDPDILYAAAATGGLFKSTNRGETWTPRFDDQAILTLGDLALAPSNPDILYVGTGEANGGHNNYAGGGLYRSLDGGDSWAFKGLENTVSIGRIVVDPNDADRVFVAAVGSYFAPNPDRGVYRTLNGGDTWTQVLAINDSTGVIDLIMRPDDPDVLIASAWQRVRRPTGSFLYGEHSGLYRSTDGGDTWTPLTAANGLPDPEDHRDEDGRARIGRIGLTVSQAQPNTMYAYFTSGTGYLDLFRSDDGGESWYDADVVGDILNGGASHKFTFSWYFGQVRVHPTRPDTVFVMDVDMMRSKDGGTTWAHQSGTHVDHHALAFFPDDPSVILSGNDGGVALSEDDGNTWRPLATLPITQFYEINYDAARPHRLYGGTQDNGTIRTRTGALDDWENILGGDGFYVNVDPNAGPFYDIWYATVQHGIIFRNSSANGFPFPIPLVEGIDPNENRNVAAPVVMDPSNPNRLYYGGTRIYRNEDAAMTAQWVPISEELPKMTEGQLLGTITTIAVAPSDPNVVYAGTDDGAVWVTSDFGSSWRDVTGTLPNRWVTRVVVDPEAPHIAYVTFSGLKWRDPQPHVFRTEDLGQSWTDITGDLPDAPVNAFAIDPQDPNRLFAGTDIGMFMSETGGTNWVPLDDGLPNVVIADLKIDPSSYTLIAGTYGRSMYTLSLKESTGPVAVDAQPQRASFALEPNYPNPFAHTTTLRFTLGEAAAVELVVYDILGRAVRTLARGYTPSGAHQVYWDGTDQGGRAVANGVYFARLLREDRQGQAVQTTRMTLQR